MAKQKPIPGLTYIVTAAHYDQARGGTGSGKAWVLRCRDDVARTRGVYLEVKNLESPTGRPVSARIWQGQWIADCECGGASFVDPLEPVFFCFSCGNRADHQEARPVIFPDDRQLIEQLVLQRPVDDLAGLNDLERAGLSKPLIAHPERGGLARNWEPHETANDLLEQNELIDAWLQASKKGAR